MNYKNNCKFYGEGSMKDVIFGVIDWSSILLNGAFITIYASLLLFVPGFLIDFFSRKSVPRENLSDSKNVYYYLSLSGVNYALWVVPAYFVYKSGYYAAHPIGTIFLVFLAILGTPVLISLLISYSYGKQWERRVREKIGLRYIDPIPTAWESMLVQKDQPEWVMILLKDGSTVGGIYSSKSYGSTDLAHQDFFLEQVCRLDSDGKSWEFVPHSKGMYIPAEQIVLIEFWEAVEISAKKEKKTVGDAESVQPKQTNQEHVLSCSTDQFAAKTFVSAKSFQPSDIQLDRIVTNGESSKSISAGLGSIASDTGEYVYQYPPKTSAPDYLYSKTEKPEESGGAGASGKKR